MDLSRHDFKLNDLVDKIKEANHNLVDRKICKDNKDDIVLIGLWDFQDDKCSIIHKYAEDEISKLINKKEIPSNFKVSLEDDFNDENDNYFDYSQISSSESDDEDNEEEEKKTKEKVKDKVNDDGVEQEGIEEDFFIDVNDI